MIWKTGTDGTLFLQPSIYKSLTDNLQGNSVPSVPLFPMKPSESPPSLASSLLTTFFGWVPLSSFQSSTPPASRKLEPVEPISPDYPCKDSTENFPENSVPSVPHSLMRSDLQQRNPKPNLCFLSRDPSLTYAETPPRQLPSEGVLRLRTFKPRFVTLK